jgi:predicted O-methyltransferase YrrM
MLRTLRNLFRSRWHVVTIAAAVAVLPIAIWAALAENSLSLVAFGGVVAVALIGLALVNLRAVNIDRRTRKIEVRLDEIAVSLARVARDTQSADGGSLVNILGAQRLDASLRHEELMGQLSEHRREWAGPAGLLDARIRDETSRVHARIEECAARIDSRLSEKFEESVAESAALHNLFSMVDVHNEVPIPVGFAASPQTLLRLTSATLDLPRDRLVVECGSGASTVWFAFACRQAGGGRVIALEHDERYASITRAALERNGLSSYADVRIAPLVETPIGERVFPWYARDAWSDLKDINLLFADGPPSHVGRRSRYPAFPLLAGALAPDAIVVLDDIQRDGEVDVARSWLRDGADGLHLEDQGRVGRSWFFRAVMPKE